MADFDSPWKEALDVYFRAFLAFFFPHIHNDIDWSRSVEMLDKELQQIAPKSAHGRRYVDKLVKVWRKNGRAVWVLIHIEVQTQRERTFARRMYQYRYRISDHYNRPVVSLAVFADDDPNWRPSQYREELWGCSVDLTFLRAKLLDYIGREAELEADTNPFARIVLAHLKALETRDDPATRRTWKFRLVRGLYERGFSGEDVRQLFRLIDWLMELPPALDELFWDEMESYEEERPVPFFTTPERIWMKRGMLQLIGEMLRAKFGEEGVELTPDIAALNEADKYQVVARAITTAATLDDVRRGIAEAAAPPPPPPPKRKRSKRAES